MSVPTPQARPLEVQGHIPAKANQPRGRWNPRSAASAWTRAPSSVDRVSFVPSARPSVFVYRALDSRKRTCETRPQHTRAENEGFGELSTTVSASDDPGRGSYYSDGHFLLGIVGLALLRDGGRWRPEKLATHVAAAQRILDNLGVSPYDGNRDHPLLQIDSAYEVWSETYDDAEGRLDRGLYQAFEGATVRPLIDRLPRGRALDLACGTGRHAWYLCEAGHAVTGLDASAPMLSRARSKVPNADFIQGDMTALPFDDESFDSIVCGLALNHVSDLRQACIELARVLAPAGRAIISIPHPYMLGVLYWRTPVVDADGKRWSTPEVEPNWHGAYIEAFVSSGLTVRKCLEPGFSAAELGVSVTLDDGTSLVDSFEAALAGQPGVIVWLLEKAQ